MNNPMTHDDGREATCEDVSSDVSSLADAIAERRKSLDAWLREVATFDSHAGTLADFDAVTAVIAAAERRRVVRMSREFTIESYEESVMAEEAALDALAAHWGVGGDDE